MTFQTPIASHRTSHSHTRVTTAFLQNVFPRLEQRSVKEKGTCLSSFPGSHHPVSQSIPEKYTLNLNLRPTDKNSNHHSAVITWTIRTLAANVKPIRDTLLIITARKQPCQIAAVSSPFCSTVVHQQTTTHNYANLGWNSFPLKTSDRCDRYKENSIRLLCFPPW